MVKDDSIAEVSDGRLDGQLDRLPIRPNRWPVALMTDSMADSMFDVRSDGRLARWSIRWPTGCLIRWPVAPMFDSMADSRDDQFGDRGDPMALMVDSMADCGG
jgi:hypothetical protein